MDSSNWVEVFPRLAWSATVVSSIASLDAGLYFLEETSEVDSISASSSPRIRIHCAGDPAAYATSNDTACLPDSGRPGAPSGVLAVRTRSGRYIAVSIRQSGVVLKEFQIFSCQLGLPFSIVRREFLTPQAPIAGTSRAITANRLRATLKDFSGVIVQSDTPATREGPLSVLTSSNSIPTMVRNANSSNNCVHPLSMKAWQISPDGSWIVFANANYSIYRMKLSEMGNYTAEPLSLEDGTPLTWFETDLALSPQDRLPVVFYLANQSSFTMLARGSNRGIDVLRVAVNGSVLPSQISVANQPTLPLKWATLSKQEQSSFIYTCGTAPTLNLCSATDSFSSPPTAGPLTSYNTGMLSQPHTWNDLT